MELEKNVRVRLSATLREKDPKTGKVLREEKIPERVISSDVLDKLKEAKGNGPTKRMD